MNIEIISVHNRDDASKEHVLLRVTENADVGRYLLCDTTFLGSGKISNKLRHVFWFPDKKVKKGELVSLWTGTGTDTEAKSTQGVKVHRFYWNLAKPVWNDDKDCAVLIEAATWQLKAAA